MKVIHVKNEQQMSERAGAFMIKKVRDNPKAVLGLATGSTPKGSYQALIQDHQKQGTSYKTIKTINLDEYVGMDPNDSNSYHYFMRTHLFNHLDIKEENTHIPNGMATDLSKACEMYDQLIQKNPIDLQLLGIGENGHIGFNEPGTSFQAHTHVVTLTHSTRKANARFFKSLNDVPTQAITMGIASILQSQEILLLASGFKKAEGIRHLLTEPVSVGFPASILKEHPNVTLIVDEEAYTLAANARRSFNIQ